MRVTNILRILLFHELSERTVFSLSNFLVQIDGLPKIPIAESTNELENINEKNQEEENEQIERMKEAELALEGELYHNELKR